MRHFDDSNREYRSSHPWISFEFDLRRLNGPAWMRIGEALSKCDHIAGVPMAPMVAMEMHRIYLAKGVHASTQIEGNTLTEEEARQAIEGRLELPESQEYLATEVENIAQACEMIVQELIEGRDMTLTPDRIELFNKIVLKDLPPEEGVVPGHVRGDSVVVGNVYRGAPSRDCEYLLQRLCEWLQQLESGEDVPFKYRWPAKILRAILAHLYIAWIHPFGNGNGRTARLVEFQLLASAGLPTPACHLLSNYYNRTKARYYQVLRETSQDRSYPVERFITYALDGFVEELREQMKIIREHQLHVAWINYVHELFHGRHTEARTRQRDLVLSLPSEGYVPVTRVRHLTPELAERYAGKQQKTITRDLNSLRSMNLIDLQPEGVRALTELMSAFLPIRQVE